MKKQIRVLPISVLMLTLALCLPISVLAQPELDEDVRAMIEQSDVKNLSAWVADGGDINATTKAGNTMLMLAARIGDTPTLRYLISKSTDINAQNNAGATALMLAAKYNHIHIVKLLLEHGANPLVETHNGYTAANFAEMYKHTESRKVLRKAERKARAQNRKSA